MYIIIDYGTFNMECSTHDNKFDNIPFLVHEYGGQNLDKLVNYLYFVQHI